LYELVVLLLVAVLTRLRDEVEVEVVPVERTLPLRDDVVPVVTREVAEPLPTEFVVRCVVFCAAALEPPREESP
jgi:hypothetical protein